MQPLTPKQLAEEGQASYQKGDYLSAAEIFKVAAEAFSMAGDEFSAAEMLNNCSVAYLKASNAHAAYEAAKGTDVVFAGSGDIKRQAMALGNQAAALERLKRPDEAIEAYEKTAQLLGDAGENELRAYVFQSISTLQLRRRQFLEAYSSMRVGVLGITKPNIRQRFLKFLINIPYRLIK